ncbi:MAG: 6-phosphofructokinase [Clostridia bacterium]|nr:6-phosphofructokinase [Clostridia bacterium]
MKTIAVLTSGGDAPGMNACIRAITRSALSKGIKVIGVKRGYSGLIDGEFVALTSRSVGNILHTGGTILKTSRCPEFLTKEGFNKALANIKKAKIDGLIVIGGDGSYRGALELAKAGVNVVAIPGTIDNDLHYTDYTLGFDTAVNTIVQLVNNVRDTSLAHDRISVIEVMGAYCGDIALNVGAATGADYIIVPEVKFEPKKLYDRLLQNTKNGKLCSIVILNEKVAGAGELATMIAKNTGLDVRPLVVAHIQRGGTPTADDRIMAVKFGAKAVELLVSGNSGQAIGIYADKVMSVPLDKAFENTRKFDMELYKMTQNLSF